LKTKLSILLGFLFFAGNAVAGDLRGDYPGPWRENVPEELLAAMGKNHIRSCGQIKFQESVKQKGEYLVYCTRDGEHWTAYLVWSDNEKVMGPYPADLALK